MDSRVAVNRPTRLVKPDCANATLDGDLLSCSLAAAPIHNSREESAYVCVFRANHPVPSDVLTFYFEMRVVQRGDLGDITIGFIPAHAKPGIQPGLMADSIGLNGMEGHVYKGTSPGTSLTHAFRPGDIFGAGIIASKSMVFFTRNGSMIASQAGEVRKISLVPAVSLRGRGPAVTVNFGQQEFAFSLDDLMQQERAAVHSQIRSGAINTSHLHTVVRDYLVAHAYEDTLSHFDKSYSQRALPCLSRQQQARPTYSAGIRKQVYAAIVGRNADLAMQLVEQHFPDILNPGGESSAALYLCCQSFIDKLMIGNVDDALAFAQKRLRPFKQCSTAQHHQQLLHDTLALLAYPDPEKAPMSYLVLDEHRRKAARVVNAAILFHLVNSHRDSAKGGAKGADEASAEDEATQDDVFMWRPDSVPVLGAPSFLERMMQQLCVVQSDLGSAGGVPEGVQVMAAVQDAADIICEDHD